MKQHERKLHILYSSCVNHCLSYLKHVHVFTLCMKTSALSCALITSSIAGSFIHRPFTFFRRSFK